MHHRRFVHLTCRITSAALLLGGLMLVVTYGFNAPPWLLKAEVATLSLLALVGGFSATLPSLRSLATLLRLRAVRGAVLVALGVAAVYLPPSLIASAGLLFFGIRLVWASACDLAEEEQRPRPAASGTVRADAIERQPAASLPGRVDHVPAVHAAGRRRPDGDGR